MKTSINMHFSINKIMFDILLFCLFIVCILNNRDPDFINYENQYIAYGTGQTSSLLYRYEPLYAFCGVLFYKLGLSFYQYRIFIFTIVFLMFKKVVLDYAKKTIFVLMCFAIFPFLLFCVQMRNAVGIVLIMYGIRFLKDNTKESNAKYIIWVIIASMFHEMCLFYLALVFVNYRNFYKLFKWFVIAEFMFVYTIFPSVLRILFTITHNRRFWYYNTNVPMDVVIRHSFPVMLLVLVLLYCRIKCKPEIRKGLKIDELFIRCSLVSCSFILFIKVNINFSRLIYFMMPFITITISNISSNTDKRKVKNDRYLLRSISIAVVLLYYIFLLSPLQREYYESVTQSILPWLK